ncbi:MAG: lipocalin-like domain-containing protein [Anaerolineaceae bacterium]|nr:lipocalin-like domain-containing protein [Anaerolineaceae bacterium]
MNKKILILIVLVISLIIILVSIFTKPNTTESSNLTLINIGEELEIDNFKKATGPLDLIFPEDLGAHPEYLTEWWYYTGNVFTQDGRHFGYQLTFFRRAITDEVEINRESEWSTNQIYMAHFAITDTKNNNHYVEDQISRGAAGLAGTKIDPWFSIWLKDWEIIQKDKDIFQLKAMSDIIELNLTLTDKKGFVFHGNNGLSQKGEEVGNASYYFSQTRLDTHGVVRIEDEKFNVSGLSWMDHEFGTSTLGENQIGWDWFSMQLDNEMEIMLFQIREEAGSISPLSSGTIINPENSTKNLSMEDFEIQVNKIWKNSDQVEYPNSWKITIPDLDINLEITPVIDDQEMNLFFRYWEGAVRITGTVNGEVVSGYGYVELTGYAQSMQGVF